MTSTQVLDLKGNKTHEITLNDDVFAAEVKVGTMHTALLRQLANGRAGSANTKTRAEVRGGGAKPWRQKGTAALAPAHVVRHCGKAAVSPSGPSRVTTLLLCRVRQEW